MEQNKQQVMLAEIKIFAIKTATFMLMLGVLVSFLMPDIEGLAGTIRGVLLKKEKDKILLISFIQNPAALYRISELEEKEGKLESAITWLEMGIGLLEMHTASPLVISRYSDRLKRLILQRKNEIGQAEK